MIPFGHNWTKLESVLICCTPVQGYVSLNMHVRWRTSDMTRLTAFHIRRPSWRHHPAVRSGEQLALGEGGAAVRSATATHGYRSQHLDAEQSLERKDVADLAHVERAVVLVGDEHFVANVATFTFDVLVDRFRGDSHT